MVNSFQFAKTPHLIFGKGRLNSLPTLVSQYRGNILVLTRGNDFLTSPHWARFREGMEQRKIEWFHDIVDREPSPGLIDEISTEYSNKNIACVVGIGGGSVLDAGKAVSAMLGKTDPIRDYLEGIGKGNEHDGSKITYFAVPTTSGTGAEATKNAVLSEIGENGYKKSLRHDNLVPDIAILDPELTLDCPKEITSASGMDAFTQLLEPYLSPKASDLTDPIAEKGLKHVVDNLEKVWKDGSDIEARSGMMLAAYYSGICLANAGLGVVHGFASSIGGMFDIPHGVICGTLMGPVNKITVRKLRKMEMNIPLQKYATVGQLFSGVQSGRTSDYYCDFLIDKIYSLTGEFGLKKLSEYGIFKGHIPAIVIETASRDNPVALEEEELVEILEERL